MIIRYLFSVFSLKICISGISKEINKGFGSLMQPSLVIYVGNLNRILLL